MVGAEVEFCFSDEWESLVKTAVFIAGEEKRVVIEAKWLDNICTIPHECLAEPDLHLLVGVYGAAADGSLVIPTVYADLGMIWVGTSPDAESGAEATPELWAQLQSQINLKESLANKVTSLSAASTDAQYPSAKAVYDALSALEIGTVVIEGTVSDNMSELTITTGNAWQKVYDAWNDPKHPTVILRLSGVLVAYLTTVDELDEDLGVAMFSIPSSYMFNGTPPYCIWLFQNGTTIITSTLDTMMSDTSDAAVQNKVIKAYIDEQIGNINTLLSAI